MDTIERDELKAAIDRGDDIRLVMAMHQDHFDQAHIPGSVHLFELDRASELLQQDDDIVVYCSDRSCPASALVSQKLIDAGYTHVRHYAGGLSDWAAAGYELESTQGS